MGNTETLNTIEKLIQLVPEDKRLEFESIVADVTARQLAVEIRQYFWKTDIVEQAIDKALFEVYGFTLKQLQVRSRKSEFMGPRQVAIATLCAYTKISYESIGSLFNLNYATVIHAKKRVANKMSKMDSRTGIMFDRMKASFLAHRKSIEESINSK